RTKFFVLALRLQSLKRRGRTHQRSKLKAKLVWIKLDVLASRRKNQILHRSLLEIDNLSNRIRQSERQTHTGGHPRKRELERRNICVWRRPCWLDGDGGRQAVSIRLRQIDGVWHRRRRRRVCIAACGRSLGVDTPSRHQSQNRDRAREKQ